MLSTRPLPPGAGWCALAAAVGALAACDSLTVKPFSGTAMVLDLSGAVAPNPSGEHLEMWGRNDHDDIIRISYLVGSDEQSGFQVRLAIDPRDPCVINDSGYLLTDERAYSQSVMAGGVTQTPSELAKQVQNRIRQVTAVDIGGSQQSSLLLATPVDDTPWPSLAADAAPADRRAACQAYWARSRYSYTPDPFQLGTPMHSVSLGPVDYTTSAPQQRFSGIQFSSPFDLSNLRELWITVESVAPAAVDPLHRGRVWLVGPRADLGKGGVINFSLKGDGGVSGSVALIVQQRASAF